MGFSGATNYVEPKDDYDYYSNGDDYNDKINIEMLISAYSNNSDELNEECLKYDGVKAYIYKYRSWWSMAESYDGNIKDYIEFIDKNWNKKIFRKYFNLNESNYAEKYFREFTNHFEPNEELILKNFERIGNGILYYDLWDLNRIFEENNISNDKKQHYLNLYFNHKNKDELISNIKNFTNQNTKAFEEVGTLRNERNIWIYILLISILIILILK